MLGLLCLIIFAESLKHYRNKLIPPPHFSYFSYHIGSVKTFGMACIITCTLGLSTVKYSASFSKQILLLISHSKYASKNKNLSVVLEEQDVKSTHAKETTSPR